MTIEAISSRLLIGTIYKEVHMSAQMYLLIGVILTSTAFGIYRNRTDGMIKTPSAGSYVTAEELGHDMGSAATFIQFSSPYCQPCKATARIIEEILVSNTDVAHVDLQVADHLDLVNQFKVLRTPTTVLVNARGHIEYRAEGLATREDLEAALAKVLNQ